MAHVEQGKRQYVIIKIDIIMINGDDRRAMVCSKDTESPIIKRDTRCREPQVHNHYFVSKVTAHIPLTQHIVSCIETNKIKRSEATMIKISLY